MKNEIEYVQFAFEFNNNDLSNLQEISRLVRDGFDILNISVISSEKNNANYKIVFSREIPKI
jgi:hypothetical protein